MSDTLRDPLNIETLAEQITDARMAYYGYEPDQIADAKEDPHRAGTMCTFEGVDEGWNCTDGDTEEPLHPIHDEYDKTAEMVMWVLEHPALKAAIAVWLRSDEAREVADGVIRRLVQAGECTCAECLAEEIPAGLADKVEGKP